ncbi:MAG: Adenylate cyclase [Candidatus Saccharicenans subterraneus]|uniref:non-specific serine/threonine protein kinase n=1 Tax=Candidatus Saccharicenans subterraneus TaxID=2508984 RepID=A0A3E2BM58_9BACT|nr:MAG: Adenylate cyclase [Candidatus Saccharicenans subterraneum]
MKQSKSGDDIEKTLTAELWPAGTEIKRYLIQEVLGLGAFSTVYLAYDRDLDRKVALKFLAGDLCQNPDWRKRFREEAQTVAQLNHPHIVTIYGVDEFQDQPYIIMEFVEGGTLEAYLKNRRLPVEEALELAIQISDGLAEAHGRGIIHRDLKPSNIMVTSRGRAKIVDFGLAAILTRESLAQEGLIVGTAPYMSPEQVQGLPIDNRSDLFSLGIVLYRMFTGKAPFSGEGIREIFKAILDKEPLPMSEYSANIPVELERIVARLLNKNKALRYQRAEDLRIDLRFTLEAVMSGRVQYRGRKKDYQWSIAVLPLANLSGEREQEYFCDGMSEEIINALAKVRGLRVAARTSTLVFKTSSEDAREIGRKLHVDTLLEGSVKRAGDRLRIFVQLIDVASGYHLWSERYDRDLQDIFAIQDEISQNVVRSLQLILSDNELQALSRTSTTDTDAYDFYLRGRQFYHQGRRQSYQFARQMFSRATEIDPNYALAYAGIAQCSAMLFHFYGESGDIHLEEADRTSRRSLELDPELPQAHAARGLTLWLMDRFEEARNEFETAMRLDPQQDETPYLYGRACFQRGELKLAAELFERACRSRENHEACYFAAQTQTALGNNEAALAAYQLALRAVEKRVQLHPDDARAYTMGAVSFCRLGDRRSGLEWAERAIAIDPNDAGIQYNVACLFALEGEKTRAIQSLEAAVQAGFAHRDWVEKDPDLDSLRDDPRFKALKWRDQ